MRYAGASFAIFLAAVVLVAMACSDALVEEQAASKGSGTPSAPLAAASPTLPFATPPYWDCAGTPPPGWMTPDSASGSGCVLLPTPDPCAWLMVAGRDVCLPHGVAREVCCTGGGPQVTTIRLGASSVTWQTYRLGGEAVDEVLEWSVAPEDAAAFADLERALMPAGVPSPVVCEKRILAGVKFACVPATAKEQYCCPATGLWDPVTTTLELDGSVVSWVTTYDAKEPVYTLLNWDVRPEHEAQLAKLKAALSLSTGQGIP